MEREAQMGRKEMSYYDIIGDVHGSATKLTALLGELGCDDPAADARPSEFNINRFRDAAR